MKAVMRFQRGFTLIELMIAVAIVAILAAVAIPSYSEYVRRGRITDAISALSSMQVKMEQHYQDYRSYSAACGSSGIASMPASTNSFDFDCPLPHDSSYTLRATGKNSMSGAIYTINQSGQKAASAPTGWSNQGCGWVLKKDGSC